jgi:catechol 2,3-dioxygenase-like lactoylglutathione lyase family enzyme
MSRRADRDRADERLAAAIEMQSSDSSHCRNRRLIVPDGLSPVPQAATRYRPEWRAFPMRGANGYTLRCTGVSELALLVTDLAVAEEFYASTLGLPVVERWESAVWLMAGERTRIGLWLATVPPLAGERGGSHVHFALHIDDTELAGVVQQLEQTGHAVKVIEFPDGRGRAAYVTDPDGNVVEFWTWDVAGHLAADSDQTTPLEAPTARALSSSPPTGPSHHARNR